MNNKLFEFKNRITNKKIAVLGIGVSNTPLILYLAKIGLNVTAFDKREKKDLLHIIEMVKGYNVKFCLGKNYLNDLRGFDIIFRSPGIRFDIPELISEKNAGAEITSEIEVFMEICPAKIFGITGSDGKTTTSTIVHNILMHHGYKCWLGGNIGTPLLDKIDEMTAKDMVVLELSSFQLQTMHKSPDVALITNISPNHLDYHESMDEYIESKKNIFVNQNEGGLLVLNYDNNITKNFCTDTKSNCRYFSSNHKLEEGVYVDTDQIIYKYNNNSETILNCGDIILPGKHNLENYLAAVAATIDFVSKDTIIKTAKTFKGVEHRIELVRNIDNVKYYNDSIASSPTRTIAGLNSFKQKIILISGGYDKNIPYDDIGEVILEKVKCLILMGQTGIKIKAAVEKKLLLKNIQKKLDILEANSLEDAVSKAHIYSKEGDIVILSPASASFDMFKNFEERGNKFKELVNLLNPKSHYPS